MLADRLPRVVTAPLLACVLCVACGGAATDSAPQTSADASGADSGSAGPKRPRGDGALDTLDDLREQLKKPNDKKQLDLAAKGWGAELGRVLGEADSLASLEKLDVSDNDLGPEGARGLLGSSHLGALAILDLGGNDIGDDGATALAQGKLQQLTTLNLSGNAIGPEGAKALAKGKGYPALSSLDLSMNPIGADGVKALGSGGFAKLSALFLLGSEITRVHAETEQRINTEREDMLIGTLRFANGVVGVLDVNWLTPTKIRELSVLGERGMFVVDYLARELTFYENDAAAPSQPADWAARETSTCR